LTKNEQIFCGVLSFLCTSTTTTAAEAAEATVEAEVMETKASMEAVP